MHLSSLSKYANKGPCSTWLLTVFLHAAYKYDAIGPSVRLVYQSFVSDPTSAPLSALFIVGRCRSLFA